MNEGNLKPFGKDSDLTEREQRKIQSHGGQKSAESRRRKKGQRELMAAMLKAVPDLDKAAVQNLRRLGFKGRGAGQDQFSIETIGMAALLQKVMRGDTRAYQLMLEILGEDAYSQREYERQRHEEEMAGAHAESTVPDDGFVRMLSASAEEVFADGMDEPANIDD